MSRGREKPDLHLTNSCYEVLPGSSEYDRRGILAKDLAIADVAMFHVQSCVHLEEIEAPVRVEQKLDCPGSPHRSPSCSLGPVLDRETRPPDTSVQWRKRDCVSPFSVLLLAHERT